MSHETRALRTCRPGKAGPRRRGRADPGPIRARCRRSPGLLSAKGLSPLARHRSAIAARGGGRHPARPCVGARRQLRGGRLELFRSRRRDRIADPGRADPVQQGAVLHRRPERRHDDPQGRQEDRLGGRARHRHRRARQLRCRQQRPQVRGRLLHLQRRVGARIPDRARRRVEQGQGLPDLRPARALAGHGRRGPGRAEPRHVARRQRQAGADRLDQDDDLRLRPDRLLHLAIHDPGAGRHDHHRHPAGRRPRHEAAAVLEGRRRGHPGIESLGEQRQTVVAYADRAAQIDTSGKAA